MLALQQRGVHRKLCHRVADSTWRLHALFGEAQHSLRPCIHCCWMTPVPTSAGSGPQLGKAASQQPHARKSILSGLLVHSRWELLEPRSCLRTWPSQASAKQGWLPLCWQHRRAQLVCRPAW